MSNLFNIKDYVVLSLVVQESWDAASPNTWLRKAARWLSWEEKRM